MTHPPMRGFLDDLLVIELGQRMGSGICGSLLAEIGATVVTVETATTVTGDRAKGSARDSLAAGKLSLKVNPADTEDIRILAALLARAAMALVSSDTDPAWPDQLTQALAQVPIVSDLTAFGDSGPFAARGLSDPFVQALAGAMDTSGEPDGPPALCRAPIIEFSAALYATSGIMAALRALREQGIAQRVDVALYDCAVGMLATFLPKNFAGGKAQRVGNHHPAMSPWNTYRAKDGWVLLCAGTNDQWSRVCKLIGRPELTTDPRFTSTSLRVANNDEVDKACEAWVQTLTIAECVDKLNAVSISTAPILPVAELSSEPNLKHRAVIREIEDRASERHVRVPGTVLRGSVTRGVAPDRLPAPDEDRAACIELTRKPARPAQRPTATPSRPLAGLRVIEMGQFTTAPLVGRQLGALGADVIKLEPNGGEPAREMPPHRNGHGYFFTLSNSDTRVMTVDLRDPGRVELLSQLITKADVLVENTKPGTLGRHGFTPERILAINPRIIYCAISGFGIDSPNAGLGAMDTTIQGLAGIMDLTRIGEIPYKTGISIADLHAGQLALVATLAALEYREHTGRGQCIDLAMLDAASWVTRTTWNTPMTEPPYRTLAARDGHVLADAAGKPLPIEPGAALAMDRSALSAALSKAGVTAVPVLSVSEVIAHPQATTRGLIFKSHGQAGDEWPLLACPIRLSRTPATVSRVPGALNADAEEILRDWAIDWRAPQAAE